MSSDRTVRERPLVKSDASPIATQVPAADATQLAANDPTSTHEAPHAQLAAHDPTATQHVPDGPATPLAGHDPTATQYVPDGPVIARSSSELPRFGRFQALAQIGAGGMGTVFRARDEVLGRDVAIKALAQGDAGVRERFLREARAIGAVLHPNILAIYDANSDDASPYLVMELASGGSLREHIANGQRSGGAAITISDVREIGIQIAGALAAAHAAGILHRDVKPANILATHDGTWKLADFGIARLPDSTLTIEGQFLGSPSYAAPESLRDGEFSPTSDIYGLGATLYEALTSAPPHGDHDMRSLIRKLEQEPPPVHTRRAVPGPLGDAIMAALSRDPTQRPSADELARQLAVIDPNAMAAVAPAAKLALPAIAPASNIARAAAPAIATLPQARSSRRIKLIAGVLAATALALILLASQRARKNASPQAPLARPEAAERSDPKRSESGDRSFEPPTAPRPPAPPGAPAPPAPPGAPTPPGAPAPPGAPGEPAELTHPMVVDEHGNVVDEETAKQILDQLERDARDQFDHSRGRGRGRWKHEGRGD